MSTWAGRSVVSAQALTRTDICDVVRVAEELREKGTAASEVCAGNVVALLFLEASTRTRCSFEAAALRLGARVFNVLGGGSSSLKKGESLSDTVRTLSQYADCLVLRQPQKGAMEALIGQDQIPLLNAGDGAGEHPTQALLDVYTMLREWRGASMSPVSLDGVRVTLVGDLKHGRTVHSLAVMLGTVCTQALTLTLVSPESLRMPEEVLQRVRHVAPHVHIELADNLNVEVLASTDVLYCTRIQKERFADAAHYEQVRHAFCLDAALMQHAPADMIVMHPLPRVDEIAPEVDVDSRAVYFKQVRNGMYARMALLALVLGRAS
ncbi:MAG: hypothetical protein MHM6MM_005305 [Cercozoa sp. M6MM]